MVRLVTAVEAVRRKRKAAVRLWVGVEGGAIAVPEGGREGGQRGWVSGTCLCG